MRVVNVVDLLTLEPSTEHPHGISDSEFDSLFTTDKPVIFAYHGYPWLIHRLTYRRHNHHNIHVRGYKEEGTTTTPFDMTVMNDMDRYHLVMDVIDRVPSLGRTAAYLRQDMSDRLIRQWAYTRQRLVICHLGSGASVTAVAAGRSVDTTMGYTPMEGLVMANRPGDLDPGVILWAWRQGLSLDEVDNDLEHRAGLTGLSGGRAGDMRELLEGRARGDKASEIAVAVYLHRLQAKIAAMFAAMRGADTIVFTGGVGEHAAAIRAEAGQRLAWLGVDIDEQANLVVGEADADISSTNASVNTLVVHAREDLQIAAECRSLLAPSQAASRRE